MRTKLLFLLGLLFGLVAASRPATSQSAPQATPKAAATAAGPTEESAPADENVPVAVKHWRREVKKALGEEQFARLDEIARQLRTDKSRLPGGGWRLQDFYSMVDAIGTDDAEAQARIALLQRWIAARPESITPHVAMGGVLHRWAWRARGGGSAETVTNEGWRLFHERLAQSAKELTEAQKLHESCPHLYFEWMTVGLGQDWAPEKMRAMFERAVKAEPDYVLYYQLYANYLQPKWDGEKGEATALAKTVADKRGGAEGDALYYQMALTLIHHGNPGIQAKEMDWPRIQRGYQVTKERYGVTGQQEERMAYMAWKFRDAAFASKQFEMLGAKWSKGVWHNEETYDKARDWAKNHS
ncbi:MAG: DUF4034 domain-containing protein [Terracidiphilus sp.]|nr:DUF4034 domain-containing protein [Terracidiphilus sp.]